MENLKFSILIPSYNGAKTIRETLRSVLTQSFSDFEIIISDDASTDDTEKVVRSIGDPRINFFKNSKNLGYPGNLERARLRSRGEFIYLMGQDDILGEDALRNTAEAFNKSDNIGAVTRPYFWFDEKIEKPVRAKKQLNKEKDETVKITELSKIIGVFDVLDQFSGLAYRRKFMTPFHGDIFPCHVYPFARIFKEHPIVFLRDYNTAVRIRSSQSRLKTSIYDKSPLGSWARMFENVFIEPEFSGIKKYCIKNFVAKNYIGLAQIKNYSSWKNLFREIGLLIKYRWQNLLSPQFWFFSLGSILIPSPVLISLIDWYKNTILARGMGKINFKYKL